MSDETREAARAAIPGVLETLGWPDDRAGSAHVEADGYQVTPAGLYWELAGDVAEAVLTAAAPLIEAAVRRKAQTIAQPAEAVREGAGGVGAGTGDGGGAQGGLDGQEVLE